MTVTATKPTTTSANPKTMWLLAATPVVLWLTHYAALLPHESAHSTVAWFTRHKEHAGSGCFAVPSLIEDDVVSVFMGRTSVLAIPVILLVSWHKIVPSGRLTRE